MVLEEPFSQKLIIHNKKTKWLKDSQFLPSPLVDYFLENPWAENTKNLPPQLSKQFKKQKIKCFAPVFYRDLFLGYISFDEELELTQRDILNQITQKIGLVLQNEVLKRKLIPSHYLEREFNLARKIEEYLSEFDELILSDFKIEKEESGWNNKAFPAIFETSYHKGGEKVNDKNSVIFLLCKLSDNFQRAKAIQLFTAQGFFIGISGSSENLRNIAMHLHKILRDQSIGETQIDGFMVKVGPRGNIDFLTFGKYLTVEHDTKKQDIINSPPLGADMLFKPSVIKIKLAEKATFFIRNFPLVSIKRI